MPQFQHGDKVKVKGEKGHADATVIGVDAASGMYRLLYHAVEASDGEGHSISTVAAGVADGFAPGSQMIKRRRR